MTSQPDSILAVIGSDTQLRRVSSHRGGEYHGPCPFCGGTDRFRVQPERNSWKCRQCGKGGDSIAYLVDSGRIDKREAYRLRHGDGSGVRLAGGANRITLPPPPEPAEPPNDIWQQRARKLVSQSQSDLWSDAGASALAWLHRRGLTDETIRRAELGYNPVDSYDDRTTWGLDPGNSIWLPHGITIPWSIDGYLWRVNIRRPKGDPKYIGPAGWSNALYNAEKLRYGKPAILVEGEFDVLIVEQYAGDLVTPVATGSATGARRMCWIARLAVSSKVLLAFDADEAGDIARRYWLRILPHGRSWRPLWGDISEMYIDGYDLRSWVEAGLK